MSNAAVDPFRKGRKTAIEKRQKAAKKQKPEAYIKHDRNPSFVSFHGDPP
jgi:hypothetical protein